MKAATVFVQVALVAAGIFIYDQVRGSDPVDPMPTEAPVIRLEPPPPAEAPMPVVLEGKGFGVLERQQGEFGRRLADLEKRMKERATAVTDSGYRPSATPTTPVEEREIYTDENGIERRFADEELAWFRALKKEAEEIERRERYEVMFDRQLNRMGVSLTDEQRKGVIHETIAFRTKVRDAAREAAGKTQEDRSAAMDVLREEYKQTVYSIAPAAEAEKIVESMGRYPGFGFRDRGGGRSRPGRR